MSTNKRNSLSKSIKDAAFALFKPKEQSANGDATLDANGSLAQPNKMMPFNDCPKHPYSRCMCLVGNSAFLNVNDLGGPADQLLFDQGQEQYGQPQLNVKPTVTTGKDSDAMIRDAWLAQAKGEEVSVIGFQNHLEELRLFNAPQSLLDGVTSAIQDEKEHAQVCMKLAARFAPDGLVIQPSITQQRHPSSSIEAMMPELASEGCWGETLGTMIAAEQFRCSTDFLTKMCLAKIMQEESQHCVLAWNTIAWAISVKGDSLLQEFKKTLDQLKLVSAPAVPAPVARPDDRPELEEFGILSQAKMDVIHAQTGPALVKDLLEHLLTNGQSMGGFLANGYDTKTFDFASVVTKHVNLSEKEQLLIDDLNSNAENDNTESSNSEDPNAWFTNNPDFQDPFYQDAIKKLNKK